MDIGIFSPTVVAERFGIKYNTLDSWIRSGFFEPSIEAKGKGTRRSFSFFDILQIQLISYLKDIGINTERLKFILDFFREQQEKVVASKSRTIAVTDGKTFFKFYEEEPQDLNVSLPVLYIPLGIMKNDAIQNLERTSTKKIVQKRESQRKGGGKFEK